MINKDEPYRQELKRAFEYMAMGCVNIYEEYYITVQNSEKIAKGIRYIQNASDILHYLAFVDYPGLEDVELFPLGFQEVLKLIKTDTIDDLAKKFKVIEVFGGEFLGKEISFYEEVFLDESERFFKKSTEYDLYIKLNNDDNFFAVRELAKNDMEYAFSRALLPTVLSNNIPENVQKLKDIYKKYSNEEVEDKIVRLILGNYYTTITNLDKYYVENKGYATCKYCGSLIRYNAKNNNYSCSFDKCRLTQIQKGKRCEIGGFISNPSRVLRKEILTFIKFPSIEELNFYKKLEKNYLKNKYIRDLVLYPNKDKSDISFIVDKSNTPWSIDLKEWSNPIELGRALNKESFARNNKGSKLFIVIPDYLGKRANGRKYAYKEMLKSTFENKDNINVLYAKEFFKMLDNICMEEF